MIDVLVRIFVAVIRSPRLVLMLTMIPALLGGIGQPLLMPGNAGLAVFVRVLGYAVSCVLLALWEHRFAASWPSRFAGASPSLERRHRASRLNCRAVGALAILVAATAIATVRLSTMETPEAIGLGVAGMGAAGFYIWARLQVEAIVASPDSVGSKSPGVGP